MILVITIVVFIILAVVNFFINLYVAIVIHELGHYVFRKMFGVKTCVVIGYRFKHLHIGDWHFGFPFSSVGGANHPGSYKTLGPTWKFILVISAGGIFNFIAMVLFWIIAVTYFNHHPIWYFIFNFAALMEFAGVFNILLPVVQYRKPNGRLKTKFNLDFSNSNLELVSDAFWVRIVWMVKRKPELRERINYIIKNNVSRMEKKIEKICNCDK